MDAISLSPSLLEEQAKAREAARPRRKNNPAQRPLSEEKVSSDTGNSPDLTAIEKVWPWMKKRTTFYGCPVDEDLRKAWYKEWNDLPQETIQAWIEAIPRNIQEVIRLEGRNEYAEGRLLQRSYRGRRKVGELFKHAWIKEEEPVVEDPMDDEYEDVDGSGTEIDE
ncbi:hypothetical protein EDD36DRAFT_481147 [Exophiala viscosa]|uniref:Uncharacterized protein n=1 Tax=Exophiala viscosa TaxID=2486360 RepID=A0AAN6E8A1_9EURO|nr:hypothetical protein EDD36DRAFT_481147 [Exophiala viscosa]